MKSESGGRSPRSMVPLLGSYALLGGTASLLGWILDIPRLTDWHNSGISIQPNAAVAVMAASAALLLVNRGYLRLPIALGLFVTFIGGSVLFQYLSGVHFGVDEVLMFGRSWGRRGVLFPGRMGLPGATSWTLIGLALVLAGRPQSSGSRRWSQALAFVTAGLASLSLIGYFYGASLLYTIPTLTVIAMQTASFILAISVGIVLSIPETSTMRLLSENAAAGMLVRRVLPIVIVVPVLIGFLQVEGGRAGLFDASFGSAMRTICEIGVFLVLLWKTGSTIARQEKRREASEKTLLDSQRRLSDTLETIAEGFVTLDPEWRFTYVNAEGERFLRTPREKLLGNVFWEMFPELVGSTSYKELHRVAKLRATVSYEDYKPDIQRWYVNKVYPAADGGVAVYFEDVTDQKTAERALRESQSQLEAELNDSRLLHGISVEIVNEEDTDVLYGRILDAAVKIMNSDFASIQMLHRDRGNGGELRLLAFRGFSSEAAKHWEWVQTDSGCSCGVALKTRQRVLMADVASPPSFLTLEHRRVYADLGIHAVQSTPLLSRNGEVVGVISTHWKEPHQPSDRDFRLLDILARQAADLIERKSAREQALGRERVARAEAERAVRLKDDFLATVSHELRTPLNAILGWSQILKRDTRSAEGIAVAAEVIERNGKLQAQLIEDLLDMSRILSGKMRLEIERVDFRQIIDSAVKSISPAATAKNISIRCDIDGSIGPTAGDSARLQQVVWNLLSNAVKFTPAAGKIDVTLARSGPDVELRVSDTGQGVTADFLPHLFDRFRQADSSSSRSHGGLGIGLALVRQLVELHGGRVAAFSEGEGRGATFVVTLPLVESRDGEDHAMAPTNAAVGLQQVRVLVIDDEPDALAVVQRILEENRALVTTAGSSSEALKILSSRHFDLIVSDIGMPGHDGYAFMKEVRLRGIAIPAIALTAYAQAEDRKKSVASGYQVHLSKPLDIGKLLASIKTLTRLAIGTTTTPAH